MELEIKTGYKVVRKYMNNIYLSVSAPTIYEYRVGEWRHKWEGLDYGPMCVFSNIDHAKEFNEMIQFAGIIFSCEFSPSNSDMVWTPMIKACLRDLPHGTILADAVKLIKQVEQ